MEDASRSWATRKTTTRARSWRGCAHEGADRADVLDRRRGARVAHAGCAAPPRLASRVAGRGERGHAARAQYRTAAHPPTAERPRDHPRRRPEHRGGAAGREVRRHAGVPGPLEVGVLGSRRRHAAARGLCRRVPPRAALGPAHPRGRLADPGSRPRHRQEPGPAARGGDRRGWLARVPAATHRSRSRDRPSRAQSARPRRIRDPEPGRRLGEQAVAAGCLRNRGSRAARAWPPRARHLGPRGAGTGRGCRTSIRWSGRALLPDHAARIHRAVPRGAARHRGRHRTTARRLRRGRPSPRAVWAHGPRPQRPVLAGRPRGAPGAAVLSMPQAALPSARRRDERDHAHRGGARSRLAPRALVPPGARRLALSRLRVPLGYLFGIAALILARPEPSSLLLGLPPALLGEGIRLWASGHIEKTTVLATGGPYAHTRNPLYLGSVLLGVGFAIAAWSPWVAVVAAAYFRVFYPSAIRGEAAFLADRFGDAYAEWARAVPLFLPRPIPAGRRATRFEWRRVAQNREWRTALAVPAALLILWIRSRI